MPDILDVELHRPDEPAPLALTTPRRRWVPFAAVGVVACMIAVYLFWGARQTVAPVADTPTSAQPAAQSTSPLGAAGVQQELPELDSTDALVRELVAVLSTHPNIAAWLATDGLIRNFTVAVANVAEGQSPAGRLRVWRPAAPFRTVERGSRLEMDPVSGGRYDALAAAVASIEPAGAARVYVTLKPRIEEAYLELGLAEASFDRTLERAIVVLLQTPVVDGPVPVEPKGIGYGFAEPRLEALSPPQKQLLRMGSDNVRVVQGHLRRLAMELGIPAERLPPVAPLGT